MATYFTDDFADSGSDWTERWNTTPTWAVSSGDVPIPTGTPANDWSGWTWNDVDGDADRDDVELLAVIQTPSLTGDRTYPLVVRAAGADESATLYAVALFPSSTPASSNIRIYQCNGADTPTQVATATLTLNTSTDYWVRFRVVGTDTKAKIWTGAIGDEPGTWTIDTTDSTHATVGWVGIANYSNVTKLCTVKQLGVGTNGDTAPSSAGGSATDLVVADAAHGHTADALTLTTTWLLTVQDALHAHAADAPTLSTQWLLTVADALHAHAADNLTLDTTGATNLVTADATHAHAADGLTLTTASMLAVQEALHAHAADNVTLSDAPALLVADALHAHTADGVTMTVDAWLVVADATHGHLADNVVLFVPGGTTIREVLRLSSPLRRALAGSSALARTVAKDSAIDAEGTTP